MTSTTENAIPGPRGHLMFGKLLDVWRDRLGLMTSVTEDYGDVTRFKMGPKELYFFNHPNHAKHVLVDKVANYHKGIGLIQARRALGDGLLTSEGELWKRQRRDIQPVFHRDRIAGFASAVTDAADAVLRRLRSLPPDRHVDVVEEMTELTLGVLGTALLDVDLAPYVNMGEAFEVVQDQAMFEMVTLGALPHWLPSRRNLRFSRARRELDRIVRDLVERQRTSGSEGDNLLSRLIASASEANDDKAAERIRDEIVTILLAGHETTASTLAWTLFELDRNPQVADLIRQEAEEVLGERTPTYADLRSLTYTTAVVNETLRLHPPVWILPRRAVEADVIDGYPVPAGADVMICPYTLHRHPDFWTEPDSFRPERFVDEARGDRPRYAYLPFGAGPRACVGSNLGTMEATLVTVMLVRAHRFRLPPGHQVIADPMLSLRVRGGLPMYVEPVGAGSPDDLPDGDGPRHQRSGAEEAR